MFSTEWPTHTELNRAELHTSCAVRSALEIKSHDRATNGIGYCMNIDFSKFSEHFTHNCIWLMFLCHPSWREIIWPFGSFRNAFSGERIMHVRNFSIQGSLFANTWYHWLLRRLTQDDKIKKWHFSILEKTRYEILFFVQF